MSDQASLMWDLFFGAVGSGYFIYGKKQRAVIPLACGIGLMVFPYFVSSTIMLVIVGAVLSALPFFWRG